MIENLGVNQLIIIIMLIYQTNSNKENSFIDNNQTQYILKIKKVNEIKLKKNELKPKKRKLIRTD